MPDPWLGDLASAQTLLRRLMLYAGLDLYADLHVYDRDQALYHREGMIAWFSGIEDGRCKFGVEVAQLGDPQILIAALCHEIAHAYREHHGLRQADVDREEKLTDLTTVYLGFGILTANSADRFEKTSYLSGNLAITKTRFTQVGYLPAQSMSFLLALQVLARNLAPARRKALARQLETNQAEYMTRGVRHLEARRADVLFRLGVPTDLTALEEPDLERFTRPLDGRDEKVAVLSEPDLFAVNDRKPNAERTIFALREGFGRHILTTALGVFFGAIGGLIVLQGGTVKLLGTAGLGALAASVLGWRERRFSCTDYECNARIPGEATVCPGCGGRIGGRIRARREIFAGEE
ncbi:MAG TPA: hypothetical protein VIE43_04580 [Thermoanaerobaculia bacterium]|nr:hypothetical protein [Thermoanaerobaculia bacterium]